MSSTDNSPCDKRAKKGGGIIEKENGGLRKARDTLSSTKNIKFVWIADGPGWLSVKVGLGEAFHKMDYIFNLYALEQEVLLKEF